MQYYSVAQLARLAGVSVRTLHLYDKKGLLVPARRSEAGYRGYGRAELLRLQQILFYKELGLSLQQIAAILDDPDFDVLEALHGHKKALRARLEQIQTMLATIDKTIVNLKENNMPLHEELYAGLSREEAKAYRKEAIEKYGKEAVVQSEKSLQQLTATELKALKEEQAAIGRLFRELQHTAPESDAVQEVVARHYQNIRRFWGTAKSADMQAETYKGLADLYITDDRFLQTDGQPQPKLALFMKQAIYFFADRRLS